MLADGYSTVWYALPQHLWGQMPCWTRLSHFSSPMAARGSGDIAGFSPTLEMGEVASAEVVLCAEERLGENVDTAVVSADYDSTLKAGARQALGFQAAGVRWSSILPHNRQGHSVVCVEVQDTV